ncbi:unnamed protein product [Brassica oleracea]
MYQGQSQLPRRVWSLKPQSNVFLFVYAGLCFVSDGSCFFFLFRVEYIMNAICITT